MQELQYFENLINNFIKYGISTDRYFADNWKGMIDNGIKPGAYHYYVPTDDPTAQAKHFASVLKSVAGTYTSSYVYKILLIFYHFNLDSCCFGY